MPARLFHDDFDEPIIYGDDGVLYGEETGDPVEAEDGDIFETEDGREFEWGPEYEFPTPEWAIAAQVDQMEATTEAAERQIEHLDDLETRQAQADEEAEEREYELERINTQVTLGVAERRKALERMIRAQREETERAYGYAFTSDEAEGLDRRVRREHEAGNENFTYGDAVAIAYPDGLPERDTKEALAAAYQDAEIQVSGGLTREQAAAQIDRSGEPQNMSMVRVGASPEGEEVFEVVRND